MRSALAILRKDLRHLRAQVMFFWLLLALSAIIEPRTAYWKDPSGVGISTLALLACCYVIAAAIHQEPLPGDRQYWLTRPFTARQLLASKALFIVCFVVIPVAVEQVAALEMLGIPPLHFASVLLWRQVIIVATLVLPVAALAAVTRNLAQFLFAVFLVVASILVLNLLSADLLWPLWTAPQWVATLAEFLLLAIAGGFVVSFQFARRATTASRLMLGAMVVLFFFVYKSEIDGAVSAAVRITRSTPVTRPPAQPYLSDILSIPIRIAGLPANVEAMTDTIHATVGSTTVDGAALRDFAGGTARLTLPFIPNAMSGPVQLRGWVNLTLFQRLAERHVPEDSERLVVPGVGVCTKRQEEANRPVVICLAPSPTTGIALDYQSSLRWIIPPGFSSTFVDFTRPLQPVMRFSGYPGGMENTSRLADTRSLVTVRTIAYLRGEFDFPDIRLADYRVRQ